MSRLRRRLRRRLLLLPALEVLLVHRIHRQHLLLLQKVHHFQTAILPGTLQAHRRLVSYRQTLLQLGSLERREGFEGCSSRAA